jgi:hypothetical protein
MNQTAIYLYVGLEVLMEVTVKSAAFWVVALCQCSQGDQHFGGTCRLRLQGVRERQARNQKKQATSGAQLTFSCSYLINLSRIRNKVVRVRALKYLLTIFIALN